MMKELGKFKGCLYVFCYHLSFGFLNQVAFPCLQVGWKDSDLFVEVFVFPDHVCGTARDYSFTSILSSNIVHCLYSSVSHKKGSFDSGKQIHFFLQYSKAAILYGFWRT